MSVRNAVLIPLIQNVVTQISNILSDKEGLVRRTQLQRAEYKILGKVNPIQTEA